MKYLIGLFLLSPSWACAAPFVCFSNSPLKASSATVHQTGNSDGGFGGGRWEMHYELARWNPSCEAIEKTATGLKATSLVFSGVGWGLACTGVGLPATVWLQGASIGTSVLGLIVGELPCDNKTKDAEIKRMAEVVVCAELEKQGIRCSMKN